MKGFFHAMGLLFQDMKRTLTNLIEDSMKAVN